MRAFAIDEGTFKFVMLALAALAPVAFFCLMKCVVNHILFIEIKVQGEICLGNFMALLLMAYNMK